jgi:hypothetical protein
MTPVPSKMYHQNAKQAPLVIVDLGAQLDTAKMPTF